MRFLDTEVKYKKAPNALEVPKPKIIMRTLDGVPVEEVRVVADNRFEWKGKQLEVELKLLDPDTHEEVPETEALEILRHYKYKHIDRNGNVIEKIKNEWGKEFLPVEHFELKEDGTEEQVSPFPRTNVIEVPEENWIPSPTIDEFLIETIYEIFADNPVSAKKLFDEAEKRHRQDQIGLTKTNFSWGGFLQYYAFLCPHFRDGKFEWLMKLSSTKIGYDHLQDPPEKITVPIREAPTLKTLPPVMALVVAAKKKKKS